MGLEYKNDINPTKDDEGCSCPLVNFIIDKSDCLSTTMVVAGFMDENSMKDKFKTKENWKEICLNCQNFKF